MIDLSPIAVAVRQSAQLCKMVQEKYIVQSPTENVANKAGAEPVTIADYGSQAIICRAISQFFPEDGVIAEEGGQQFSELIDAQQQQDIVGLISQVLGEQVSVAEVIQWLDYGQNRESQRTWVIDPIDGTKGFIALRNYAIAVGILEDGIPTRALMGTPGYTGLESGALFHAQDGKAFIEPLSGGSAQPIHVSQRNDPNTIIFVESVEKAHGDQDVMALVREKAGMSEAELNRLDSQEKYCLVANGEADAYLRFPFKKGSYSHKIWDHAAGVAIVQAAGGIVTDLDGSALNFSLGKTLAKNKGMIVANPRIHERLVEAASHFEF